MLKSFEDGKREVNYEFVYSFRGKKHSEETKKIIGQKNSIHQKGKNNSQFGTCWIYNDELKESKKININQLCKFIEQGWIRGRKIKKY